MEDEFTIGYVDNLASFGIIEPSRASLILTNKRLIIVYIDSTNSFFASIMIENQFGVLAEGMVNKISADEIKKATKLILERNLDDVINADPRTIVLDVNDVQQVKIDRRRITIITNKKKFHFKLANPDVKNKQSDTYDTYVDFLKTTLPNKIMAKNP